MRFAYLVPYQNGSFVLKIYGLAVDMYLTSRGDATHTIANAKLFSGNTRTNDAVLFLRSVHYIYVDVDDVKK